MKKNYYDILGVSKSSSKDDIKKAFRKLAHQYHPDKQGGDAARFKEASEAYAVLSDDKKRQEYDTYGRVFGEGQGPGGFEGGQGFGGFDFSNFAGQGGFQEFDLGDIFGEFFGGGGARARARRGRDISVDLELSFKEAIFGVERKIRLAKVAPCEDCNGTGGKSSETVTCKVCQGKGKIQEVKRSLLGSFQTTRPCDHCHGAGKIPKEPCGTCRGEGVRHKEVEIAVKIPSGVENGEMVRLQGGGEALAHGTPGDLYIKIHVREHPTLRKEGNNLVTTLRIKLTSALLGGEYAIETLDGPLTVKIPPHITFGELLRIKGKGVPEDRNRRGDLIIHVEIDMPRKLSKEARSRIEELRKEGI